MTQHSSSGEETDLNLYWYISINTLNLMHYEVHQEKR